MTFGLSLNPYSLVLIAAVMVSLLLAARASMGTRAVLARSFALFLAAILVWCVFAIFEIEAPSPEGRMAALKLEFVGVCLIPGTLALFARELAQRPRRGPWGFLVALPGLAFIAVVATNDLHRAFWTGYSTEPGSGGAVAGWAYWAFAAYACAAMAAALAEIVLAARRARGLYSRWLKLVLALIALPVATGAAFMFLGASGRGPDPTPAVFAFSGLGVSYALSKFDVFDAVPYAKNVVLESIDTPILVADASGIIMGANDEARRFFPGRASLEGSAISEIAPVLGGAMADREARSYSRGGADYLVTCYFTRKGPREWRGRLFLFRNVTALAKANRDLSEANRALSEARARAEAANASKSAFVATVSHELRNPLGAIIGLTDLCLGGSLPDGARADLETIRSMGDQLLGVVNDLLDISKMEAGKLELESVDFDLAAQAMSVIRAFRPAAALRGVALDVQIEDGSPRIVRGDPLRFGQVLMNLLGNAVKFTPRGSIVVRIAGSAAPPDGDPRTESALVEVEDTGIGISASGIENLFKEFSQADRGVSRRYGGTGLGLSICKRLVGLMGGEIRVESREGAGSAFSFTARFEPGDAASLVSKPGESEGENPARVLRVLVADDDSVNSAVARRYIERLGHEVTVAATGAEALERLRGGAFDLALIDLHLADADGLEIARSARSARAEAGDIPVFLAAMTAGAGPEAAARCRSAGMDGFLTKPIDPDGLRLLVARVCEEAPLSASSASACDDAEEGGRAAEPSGAVASSLIDIDALLGDVDGDGDFARQLLRILVEEAPERGRAIGAAADAGDLRALRSIAHKIRGSALTLRSLPLAKAAESVEAAALAGDGRGFGGLGPLAASLGALLEGTAAEARGLLDRMEPEGAASSRMPS